MMAAEVGTRRRGTRCARTGRCRELGPGEQEEVERDQPGAGFAGWAGPGFLGLAGCSLVHHNFLNNNDLLVDHHPVVVQRVAH